MLETSAIFKCLSEDKSKREIAYFTMEAALANDIPSYSGGLGVLAGDTLRSAADLGIPMVGHENLPLKDQPSADVFPQFYELVCSAEGLLVIPSEVIQVSEPLPGEGVPWIVLQDPLRPGAGQGQIEGCKGAQIPGLSRVRHFDQGLGLLPFRFRGVAHVAADFCQKHAVGPRR